MFNNFEVTAYMSTPTATIDFIILDSILSAAKAKELLGDEYYKGQNIYGTKEQTDSFLVNILDKKQGVYCTSAGIGDNKEYITSWCKRWDDKNDDMVGNLKGKARVDVGAGHFKNYHMPIIIKSYKTITFYIRGDKKEVERLLNNYIFYLGKKSSQGYGKIRKWEVKDAEEDWSLWKDGKPMRPIPTKECGNISFNIKECAIIPPYWREDNRELCVIPEEGSM